MHRPTNPPHADPEKKMHPASPEHETASIARRASRPTQLQTWLGGPATLGLSQRPRWSILGFFVAADAALIVIHVVNVVTIKTQFLRINVEFGLGEIFQYGKFLVISFAMALLARRSRQVGPALWGLIFAYLAADDAFAIHEAFGRSLARWWGLEEGAIISQVGAGLTLGVVVGALAVTAYFAGGLSHRVAAVLGFGLVGLGFFAVGVDAFHGLEFVSESRYLNIATRLVEEGGEMLAASFLVAFALMVMADQPSRRDQGPAVAPEN